MYIATIPNRNSPPAILLRHAYRENGKVKNRTLANLSHWQSARIEALRRALRGEFDHASLSAEPTLGPIFGLLYVLKQIAEALGITAALSNTTLGKLALFLVLARLPHQGSRPYAGPRITPSTKCWDLPRSTKTISTRHSTICVHGKKRSSGPCTAATRAAVVHNRRACFSTTLPAAIWKARRTNSESSATVAMASAASCKSSSAC